MFRLSSLSGLVVDDILAARGKNPLSDEYYKKVSVNIQGIGEVRLINDNNSNSLVLNWNDVIFSKETVDDKEKIHIDSAVEEFEKVWKIIDTTMKIRDVRRIGIFTEYQIGVGVDDVSKRLLNTLTTIKKPAHAAKFSLTYEERRPTVEGIAPDIEKSDMFNIIYSYYDGELDATNPRKQTIKADLDVQRYFYPYTSSTSSEVLKLKKVFIEEKKKLYDFLHDKGIVANG